ncbi:FHA domain-containing protein [Nonomuraea sp. CA-218870]|uniref:FHA domain-containing protein n=1 Tax=Nonomuraea sp. CA-218870 TaxID=3239998 RepID=UPI003D8CF7CA
MSSTPRPFRASDDERDRAIDELRERAVEGRLSHDTFVVRVDQALRARNQQELDALVADLPRRPTFRERATRALTGAVSAVSDFTTALQSAWRKPRLPRLALPDDRRRFVVGRGSACDLVLADLTVSRVHAELRREDDGGWMLADLGSLNGTRLNGWRLLAPARVRAGDEVAFGDCGFLVSDEGP